MEILGYVFSRSKQTKVRFLLDTFSPRIRFKEKSWKSFILLNDHYINLNPEVIYKYRILMQNVNRSRIFWDRV